MASGKGAHVKTASFASWSDDGRGMWGRMAAIQPARRKRRWSTEDLLATREKRGDPRMTSVLPNGWRLSGERTARVRCSGGLGLAPSHESQAWKRGLRFARAAAPAVRSNAPCSLGSPNCAVQVTLILNSTSNHQFEPEDCVDHIVVAERLGVFDRLAHAT